MNAMRSLRQFVILALAAIWSLSVQAQNTYVLSVDSILGIPDTIYDGQTITFTMVFSNQSNLGFQGQVETVMYFPGTQDTISADSSLMNANFVAAQAQESVFVSHFFSSNDDNLAIGDNVVVVWPRIDFGPTGPPQEVLNPRTVNFYLAPPLSAPTIDRTEVLKLGLFPNPAQGEVRLVISDGDEVRAFQVIDMMGRVVMSDESGQVRLNAHLLGSGIYVVNAVSRSGQLFTGRLSVRDR